MAQLKDLIVTGASRFIGDVIANQLQITKLNAPTAAGGTTYSSGSNGQVLLSNGSSVYWGSAAPTVTESTVSDWGFTKNTGTITGATENGGLKVTGTTLGHSNTAITAKTTAGVYPVKIDALGHITEAGTAIVSSAAVSGGNTLSLVTTGEKYTWNNKSNLTIGTSATTAAAGNHTHTTSLATDSGSATVTLAHNTTYKLTAGGTNVIFKTPTIPTTVSSFTNDAGYVTSSGVTSITIKTTSPVSGGNTTATTSTGTYTISLADSYGDTKNPYGTKAANYVLAGPISGNAAAPSFRGLDAADIPSLTSQKITNRNAYFSLSDDGTWIDITPTSVDVDLNSKTATGNYYFTATTNGGSLTNIKRLKNTPGGGDDTLKKLSAPGFLKVMLIDDTSATLMQLYAVCSVSYNFMTQSADTTPRIFIRFKKSDTWTDWAELSNQEMPKTTDDISHDYPDFSAEDSPWEEYFGTATDYQDFLYSLLGDMGYDPDVGAAISTELFLNKLYKYVVTNIEILNGLTLQRDINENAYPQHYLIEDPADDYQVATKHYVDEQTYGKTIHYIEGPSTDTTAGTWTGTDESITEYYNGLTIIYVPAIAGASTTTLNINGLGAKTCYYTGTSNLTTHYPVGTPILLTYKDNYWRRADYNTNTNTLQRTYRSSNSVELPIAAINTSTNATAAYSAISSGSYKDVYAAIPNTDANRVMLNPSTGLVTFGQNGLKTNKIQIPTASNGTTYGAGSSGQVLMSNGTSIYWGTPAAGITESTVSDWGFTKNTGTVTSITIKTTSPVSGGSATATTTSGTYTISLANGYGDTKNPYASKTKNYVLAAPSTANGVPTFRALVATDIPSLTKSKISDFPSNVSAFTNDSGYITSSAIPEQLFERGTGSYSIQSISSSSDSYPAAASGEGSFALSSGVASGHGAVAIGMVNGGIQPTASGNCSFSMGLSTTASANYSMSVGQKTLTSGPISQAFGNYTIASGRASMAIGQYNIEDTSNTDTYAAYGNGARKYLFIIGNGTADNARSNALTVDWNGNTEISGYLKTNKIQIPTASNGTTYGAGSLGQVLMSNGSTVHWGTLGDSFISYGGQNFTGSYSPIDGIFNNRLRPNRFAGFKAAGTTIQYSNDGGSTWTDYGASDSTKVALFTTLGDVRIIPSGNVTANSQLRITMNTGTGGTYTTLQKIMIYISTNYSQNCTVTIDAAYESTPTNFTRVICTDQPLSGWSGWNVINIENGLTTYGNTPASQYGRIRFTFKHTGVSSGHEANGLQVRSIYGYGGMGWTTPSTLAATDHVYSFDANLNVTFPANVTAPKVFGAVYNDYAEYRETEEQIEPGRVITEVGNGKLILANERLMRGCEVVSDTFGFAIGESKKCKTPTAVSGRVLVFPYESLEKFKNHIGWPVCSGPNGTVSIMTEEEEMKYPSRIIGTVSEVPDYDIWYCGQEHNPDQREVKGRIWIRVR